MFGAMKRTLGHKTRTYKKSVFHKTTELPCLTYGSEIWVLKRTDERRLETAEMRFLRHVSGYTVCDEEWSEGSMSQLGMKKLDKQIRILYDRKKNWRYHLQVVPSETAPKQLLYYQQTGRRDPGRTS